MKSVNIGLIMAFILGTATATGIAYLLIPDPQPLTITQASTTNTHAPPPDFVFQEEPALAIPTPKEEEEKEQEQEVQEEVEPPLNPDDFASMVMLRDLATRTINPNNFDQLTWGMERYKVKELFPDNVPLFDSLWALSNVAGHPAIYCFQFLDLKLQGVILIVDDKLPTHDEYIGVYLEFEEALVAKYGEGNERTKMWIDRSYEGMENMLGQAIAEGDVIYEKTWDLPSSFIKICIGQKGFLCHTTINYSNPAYLAELKEQQQKAFEKSL